MTQSQPWMEAIVWGTVEGEGVKEYGGGRGEGGRGGGGKKYG